MRGRRCSGSASARRRSPTPSAPASRAAPDRRAGFCRADADRGGAPRPACSASCPERFEALFANAYAFELPPGAVELASTEARPQAFRVGERAWGVQFHPEARLAQVLAWWRGGRRAAAAARELERELAAGIDAWHELGASALPRVPRGGRASSPAATVRRAADRLAEAPAAARSGAGRSAGARSATTRATSRVVARVVARAGAGSRRRSPEREPLWQ